MVKSLRTVYDDELEHIEQLTISEADIDKK